MKGYKSLLILVFVVTLVGVMPRLSLAQNKTDGKSGQTYTGNVIYFGGRSGATTTTFTLTINSFTPPGEVEELLATLQKGGQDDLLKAISKDKRGTLQIGSQLGRDINAVWFSDEDEGRKLTVLFERWVGFGEARRSDRSLNYPFTYLEIYLDANGKGEGTMIPAARVRSKGTKSIEVENFGIYPARLTNIKPRR